MTVEFCDYSDTFDTYYPIIYYTKISNRSMSIYTFWMQIHIIGQFLHTGADTITKQQDKTGG